MLHNLIILMILFEHIVKGKNYFMSHLLCTQNAEKHVISWPNDKTS
jgi:hypothetical protein